MIFSTITLAALVFAGAFSFQRQQQALRAGHRAEQTQYFMSQLIRLANQKTAGKNAVTLPDFLKLGVTVLPEYIQDRTDRRVALLSLAESLFDSQDMKAAIPIFQQVAADAHDAHDVNSEVRADAFGGAAAMTAGNTKLSDSMTEQALKLAQAPGTGTEARIRAKGFLP